jgi:hypothetical protein
MKSRPVARDAEIKGRVGVALVSAPGGTAMAGARLHSPRTLAVTFAPKTETASQSVFAHWLGNRPRKRHDERIKISKLADATSRGNT